MINLILLLNSFCHQHETVEKSNTKVTEESKDNMFVDNFTCGGDNEGEILLIKEKVIKIFSYDRFAQHK